MKKFTIKKEFLGGCDIVKEMYENGELKKVLEDPPFCFPIVTYLIILL